MIDVAEENVRLLPGQAVPELALNLAHSGRWKLSEQNPLNFTLIVVFRGVHCSFCKPEIEKLSEMQDQFAALGISILAVSMDSLERAIRALDEWAIGDLPFAYGMTELQARNYGLYISTRVKPVEPDVFSEPGAYLIKPDGTLYAQFQSTTPWLRLDIDTLYRGIQVAMDRGTPPRGGY